MIPSNAKEYKLFFMEPEKWSGPNEVRRVFFTTGDVTKEWGDDWDDAPWEHNAGLPYFNQEGSQHFTLMVARGDRSNVITCEQGHVNSHWSVEQINKGAVAWGHIQEWNVDARSYSTTYYFKAGETLDQFLNVCHRAGLEVWIQHHQPMDLAFI